MFFITVSLPGYHSYGINFCVRVASNVFFINHSYGAEPHDIMGGHERNDLTSYGKRELLAITRRLYRMFPSFKTISQATV